MEALLLVDVTCLYNEVATASLAIGAASSDAGFVLALVKVAVLSRFLGLRLAWQAWDSGKGSAAAGAVCGGAYTDRDPVLAAVNGPGIGDWLGPDSFPQR